MVTLSGGDWGGREVDGQAWAIDGVLAIDGLLYRRVPGDQAVYIGVAD
jgi:hypothetical protein